MKQLIIALLLLFFFFSFQNNSYAERRKRTRTPISQSDSSEPLASIYTGLSLTGFVDGFLIGVNSFPIKPFNEYNDILLGGSITYNKSSYEIFGGSSSNIFEVCPSVRFNNMFDNEEIVRSYRESNIQSDKKIKKRRNKYNNRRSRNNRNNYNSSNDEYNFNIFVQGGINLLYVVKDNDETEFNYGINIGCGINEGHFECIVLVNLINTSENILTYVTITFGITFF